MRQAVTNTQSHLRISGTHVNSLLNRRVLVDVLSDPDVSRLDKLLVCLVAGDKPCKAVKDIKSLAVDAGLRDIMKWNVSDILKRSRGFAIRASNGWELTSLGEARVSSITDLPKATHSDASSRLRNCLSLISEPSTAKFVEEAVECFEHGFYRSAAILSWVGAVAVLQDHVKSNHWDAFQDATKQDIRRWSARDVSDLIHMKERDLLVVLVRISVLDKNTEKQLRKCLDLRNSCSHPNSFEVGHLLVASHMETLIQNVFTKFV